MSVKNAIVVTDIDGLISTLYENLPEGLRQIADAIDAKRLTGRLQDHMAHGLTSRGYGLRLSFRFEGNLVAVERFAEMLESGVSDEA